jgi:hypothetical protein
LVYRTISWSPMDSKVPRSGGALPGLNSRASSLLVIQLISRASRFRSSAAAWKPSDSAGVNEEVLCRTTRAGRVRCSRR